MQDGANDDALMECLWRSEHIFWLNLSELFESYQSKTQGEDAWRPG